jgi:hypothetical protein
METQNLQTSGLSVYTNATTTPTTLKKTAQFVLFA